MPESGNILNRELWRTARPGNLGGGWRGFWSRFGRGFAGEAIPNTPGELLGTAIGVRNPITSGLAGGVRQGVTGSGLWQGWVLRNPYYRSESLYPSELEDWQRAPGSDEGMGAGSLPGMGGRNPYSPSGLSGIPSWMLPGASMPSQSPYTPDWMGAGTWPGSAPENPYYGQGQGMMRMPGANPPRGPQSRIGPRGGQTIATGTAAQNMVEGWQNAAQQAQLDAALAEARRRAQALQQ